MHIRLLVLRICCENAFCTLASHVKCISQNELGGVTLAFANSKYKSMHARLYMLDYTF